MAKMIPVWAHPDEVYRDDYFDKDPDRMRSLTLKFLAPRRVYNRLKKAEKEVERARAAIMRYQPAKDPRR